MMIVPAPHFGGLYQEIATGLKALAMTKLMNGTTNQKLTMECYHMKNIRIAFWSILIASILTIVLLYFNHLYYDLPVQSISIMPIIGGIAGAAIYGLRHSK